MTFTMSQQISLGAALVLTCIPSLITGVLTFFAGSQHIKFALQEKSR